MLYSHRHEFLYDSEIFRRADTQTALKIYAEYVQKNSPQPYPKFFEVDRSAESVDELWHMPLKANTTFTRELEVPVLAKPERPDWRLTRLGITPIQRFKFILANAHLQPMDESALKEEAVLGRKAIRLDYFPLRGDLIYYNGYRLMIVNVVLDPAAFWGQTNVWMGMVCEAAIAPEGDAGQLLDLSKAAPAEKPGAQQLPDWPGPPPTGPVPHSWP